MDYCAYIAKASKDYSSKYPAQRVGQCLHHTLAEVRPDISNVLAGSPVDCFHSDDRIPDFLDMVAAMWPKEWGNLTEAVDLIEVDEDFIGVDEGIINSWEDDGGAVEEAS